MNALTSLHPIVIPEKPPLTIDLSLFGASVAITLWLLLHAALVVSWLSAGRV